MKVYVGRKIIGDYEVVISDESLHFNKSSGFPYISYSSLAIDFHAVSNLRLRKGQMKTFDRVEFK